MIFKNFLMLTGCFLILHLPVYAQSYEQSAGIRLGATSGITYKNFLKNEQSVEVMVSGRNEGIQVAVTYLNHKPLELSFNENFYFYYGAGGHLGMERYDDLKKILVPVAGGEAVAFEDATYFIMGINGAAGLEYRWLSMPLTLSFDIRPYFNFAGMRYFRTRFWDAGFSIKYIF